MTQNILKPGNHTPTHLLRSSATYMLTASIYKSEHLIDTDLRKAEWRDAFYKAAELYQWKIIAWVVLSNHYHALLRSPANPDKSIGKFVSSYHKFTARNWNKADGKTGRAVWWNYFDTCIKDRRDFFAKLNYIHWNPVRHGIVSRPEDYLYSSYNSFMEDRQPKRQDIVANEESHDIPEF